MFTRSQRITITTIQLYKFSTVTSLRYELVDKTQQIICKIRTQM